MSDLIKQCDECRLNECINCEHSWADIQEIKKQLAEKDKEIEDYKKALRGEMFINFKLPMEHAQFKRQLAEKDKEIEEYNNYFKSFGCKDFAEFQRLIGLAKISANDKKRDDIIRKQVCDEIREKLKKQIIPAAGSWLSYYDITETNNLLDQIEKGEE